MKKETLEALKKSIQKWESIERGIGIDLGSRNCALCDIFLAKLCHGCPVYYFSRRMICNGTPYESWVEHQSATHNGNKATYFVAYCPECRDIAKQEVNFLKSLLPE